MYCVLYIRHKNQSSKNKTINIYSEMFLYNIFKTPPQKRNPIKRIGDTDHRVKSSCKNLKR